MKNLSKRQLVIGGLFFLVLVGLPLFVYFSQTKQETRSRAAASTVLYFTPASTQSTPVQKTVGTTASFDVMIDPGTNDLPSSVKLEILFDPAKLQTNVTSFVVNTAAFPAVLEGPIVTSNSVLASLSIGSDATRAIRVPTKVATITFTTTGTTTTPTILSYGSRSQVLSLAADDNASQSVLSTTTPAYVSIVAVASPTSTRTPTPTTMPPTLTPTPTRTPTPVPPTATPTRTPTPVPPTVTPTRTPTPTTMPPTITPTPTRTPTPQPGSLEVNVLLHGIGDIGDNTNPTDSAFSNKNPLHQTRTVTLQIFNLSNQLLLSPTGTVTYDSSSGSFRGVVNTNASLPTAQYIVKVKETSHLRRQVPGAMTIAGGQVNTIPDVPLVAGDSNNDNTLDILDYNMLVSCYSDLLPPTFCPDANKVATDLNDDDHVNQVDYNLFLREIGVQTGN